MNKINSTLLLSTMLTVAAYTLPTSTAKAEWSGDVEGGTVLEGDDKGTRLRFNLSNNERPFNQTFYADWVRGESDSNTYEAGYKPQYWFTDQTYLFGEASLKTAKSLMIDQQRKLFAGVGLQLLNSQTTTLFGEIGAGQTNTKFDDTFLGEEATVETTSTIARIGAAQILSDLLKLELDADYSTSEDIKQSTAEAGLSFRVPGGAIKYSYRLRSSTVGDADAVEVKDSSVSFNYNF